MLSSKSLVFSDFDSDWYKHWSSQLLQDVKHLEDYKLKANKFWQNAVITQALYERGVLKEGKQGIGFDVGRERLPALFAKLNVQVTASDQDFRTKKAKHWQKHELAFGTQSLNKLGICPDKKFASNVSYRSVDMRKIPQTLYKKFDFVWSNCALGHLGSIEAGLQFIVNSAKCLKPGGYAAHTTEINVISDYATVDNNNETVIFRPRDIRRLATLLQAEGMSLEPLNLNFGDTPADQKISVSPKFGNDYSKLFVGGHLITQIVLIVHRPTRRPKDRRIEHSFAYLKNINKQKKFLKQNDFLRSVREFEKVKLGSDSIKALKNLTSITLQSQPKYVYLEYKNTTNYPIFGMHERLYTTQPIALATADPIDRVSVFLADDWFNGQANRPSIYLCVKNKDDQWTKADYIRPGSKFAYRVKLDGKKAKKGSHAESFVIVQEGLRVVEDTKILLKITVKS